MSAVPKATGTSRELWTGSITDNTGVATLETDPDRQLDLFKRALAQGEYWLFYQDRAETLFAQGRYKEALDDANRALALEPDDGDTLVLRAKALARLGQAQAAAKDLQFVALIDPTNKRLAH